MINSDLLISEWMLVKRRRKRGRKSWFFLAAGVGGWCAADGPPKVLTSELVSWHGTAMNQRCSESYGLPINEDTKLKKRKTFRRDAK